MLVVHLIFGKYLNFYSDCAPFRLIDDAHNARVTCFAYPYDENPRYDSNLLLSGGADFAVIIWNITLGEKVHRFSCQGGPILWFIIPPANCSVSRQFSPNCKHRKCVSGSCAEFSVFHCWRQFGSFAKP